jgi:hypothetical protein
MAKYKMHEQVVTALKEAEADYLDGESGIFPYYRQKLYKSYLESGDPNGFKARGWLAIITIYKGYERWKKYYPTKEEVGFLAQPDYILQLAGEILQGKHTSAAIEDLVDQVYLSIEKAYDVLSTTRANDRWRTSYALTCGEGAYVALLVAANCDPFFTLELKETQPDYLLDGDWDELHYALKGYAMAGQDYHFATGREFWKWWLYEAIPQSWELAQEN